MTSKAPMSEFLQHQAGVAPAKSGVEINGDADGVGAGLAGDVIEIAEGVGFVQIDGRRNLFMPNGKGANHGFESTGSSHEMAGDGLGGADGHATGVIPEDSLDGAGF